VESRYGYEALIINPDGSKRQTNLFPVAGRICRD
jgi:hypothetical protein